MEIRIDFYAKGEVSVRIDPAGRYPFPANETSELFVFACLALRQLSNLGNHPVANVLAVLLTMLGTEELKQLADGTYEFPGSYSLRYALERHGLNASMDYDALKRVILPGLPSIVENRGEGKKAFVITVPPFQMGLKGFGVLTIDTNYYALQSVFALARYLARSHVHDGAFLGQLARVANGCGAAKISRLPLMDQVGVANVILKNAGLDE